MQARCDACTFSTVEPNPQRIGETTMCRRYPPVVTGARVWVPAEWVCGEFVPKIPPEYMLKNALERQS